MISKYCSNRALPNDLVQLLVCYQTIKQRKVSQLLGVCVSTHLSGLSAVLTAGRIQQLKISGAFPIPCRVWLRAIDAMKFSRDGNKMILEGVLNEETDFVSLRRCIEGSNSAPIEVSFGRVDRANSCGIIAWFKLLRDLQIQVIYYEAPVWLIELFNMNPFFMNSSLVRSFYAPFYDVVNNSHKMILLHFGKDVPVLSDYTGYEFKFSDDYGASLEPDFESKEFFQFVTSNLEHYREGVA